MLLKVRLDEATLERLTEASARELRPLPMQAAIEIRRALGINGGDDNGGDDNGGRTIRQLRQIGPGAA